MTHSRRLSHRCADSCFLATVRFLLTAHCVGCVPRAPLSAALRRLSAMSLPGSSGGFGDAASSSSMPRCLEAFASLLSTCTSSGALGGGSVWPVPPPHCSPHSPLLATACTLSSPATCLPPPQQLPFLPFLDFFPYFACAETSSDVSRLHLSLASLVRPSTVHRSHRVCCVPVCASSQPFTRYTLLSDALPSVGCCDSWDSAALLFDPSAPLCAPFALSSACDWSAQALSVQSALRSSAPLLDTAVHEPAGGLSGARDGWLRFGSGSAAMAPQPRAKQWGSSGHVSAATRTQPIHHALDQAPTSRLVDSMRPLSTCAVCCLLCFASLAGCGEGA